MEIPSVSNKHAAIVFYDIETSPEQNLAALKAFALEIKRQLQNSDVWSQDENEIFIPKEGDGLTPVEKMSDFERFWSIVTNQVVSAGKDPEDLLSSNGVLFNQLNVDLAALLQKVSDAQPSGQKVEFSDVKHLAVLSVFPEQLYVPAFIMYQDNLLTQQAKRDVATKKLQDLSSELKIYGVIQSGIQQKISTDTPYHTTDILSASDFGYKTSAVFHQSAEYKALQKITGKNTNISIKDFLDAKGIESLNQYAYSNLDDDWDEKLANLATAISDKSKLINDDVSLKTTELNQIVATTSTIAEAMRSLGQLFYRLLMGILDKT